VTKTLTYTARMEVQNLRLFLEVARRGNFAAVARDHDLDPSSVSRALSLLEDELGIRLLQRTTRHVTLTEAGEIYLSRISALLDGFDQACDEARSVTAEPSGTLRLTASVAFGNVCLIPLLPAFRALYPQIKLELLFTDAVIDMVQERVDLAIRLGQPTGTDLISTKLFNTRYHVCASPEYLSQHPAPSQPADIQQHNCLLFHLPEFRTHWLFRNAHGEILNIPVHGDVTILSALALRDCARAGMGPVLLADWLINADLAQGRLIDLFPEYHVSATDFNTAAWLLYPSRTHLPSKVRSMIDFLKQKLGH